MLAPGCKCPRPQVFVDDPGSCHRCGRPVPLRISPSTRRIAQAMAEHIVRGRRIGESPGRHKPKREEEAG